MIYFFILCSVVIFIIVQSETLLDLNVLRVTVLVLFS